MAADEAELIADVTDAAAEEADPVIVIVEFIIDMLPLLVAPPCGTGVAREVGVPVDAQVALVGKLLTPCPAQRESANLIVTTRVALVPTRSVCVRQTHALGRPDCRPY